jgi:hypothetical protein
VTLPNAVNYIGREAFSGCTWQAGASDDAFSAPLRRRQRLLRMPLKALSFVRLADIRGDSPWQRYVTLRYATTTPPHTHAREHIGKKFRQSADIVRLRTGTTSFRRLDIERGSEWHSDGRMHCGSDSNTNARTHTHPHVATRTLLRRVHLPARTPSP